MPRVVLAYSGGLDTSVAIQWLRQEKGLDVVTLSADLGQGEYLPPTRERALKNGASEAVIVDLRKPLVEEFIFPALKALAFYGEGYLLATALGRPLIARELVRYARETGADFVAHGCTGKGNDQVRFEVTAAALAPEIKVIAPLREWSLKSREEEIEYAMEHGIDIGGIDKKKIYSYDRNLWGVSVECGELEDPWNAPPEDAYLMTAGPKDAPDEPVEVVVGFKSGVPVSLDGREMDGVALIEKLNSIAGAHGVGRIDQVEDRLVGIKSREVYEAPAGVVLFSAARALQHLTLPKDLIHEARILGRRYGELVYNGLWFTALKRALDAFFSQTVRNVSGDVRVRLFKGSATVVGRRSPFALYRHSLSTYDASDSFDHSASVGFIKLWGLPVQLAELIDREAGKEA
ncbi:MAG: argininosuccinate synthase [Planctomycetes bacterium]|nr:argininosuccinate synthase [Planctomycetota bacterium]